MRDNTRLQQQAAIVNYVDYSQFGQPPSSTAYFNMFVPDSEIPETPFYAEGEYKDYWCIIGDGSIYGGTAVFA